MVNRFGLIIVVVKASVCDMNNEHLRSKGECCTCAGPLWTLPIELMVIDIQEISGRSLTSIPVNLNCILKDLSKTLLWIASTGVLAGVRSIYTPACPSTFILEIRYRDPQWREHGPHWHIAHPSSGARSRS